MAEIEIRKNGNTDPTINVREMIGSEVGRIDDLRAAEAIRQDDLRKATEKYMDAEFQHLRATEKLRAEHASELSTKESERLDSIRQVDVQNTTTAATTAAAAIQTLAINNAADAEKLRNALTTTATMMAKQTTDVATTMASQLSGTVAGITERLAALEKANSEGVGKQRMADPMMAEALAEIKNISKTQTSGTGKSEGGKAMWGYVAAGFGFLFLLMGMAGMIYAFSKVAG